MDKRSLVTNDYSPADVPRILLISEMVTTSIREHINDVLLQTAPRPSISVTVPRALYSQALDRSLGLLLLKVDNRSPDDADDRAIFVNGNGWILWVEWLEVLLFAINYQLLEGRFIRMS